MADATSIENMAILIVDDSEMTRLVVENSLRKHGFTNLLGVASGELALQQMDQFHPDIVILDVMMPGIDGFGVCSAIREMPQHQEIPILISTSATELSLRLKAFACGATDFVNNPILPDELYARVKVHLENRKYMKVLTRYKERMTQEMSSAYQLQASILPQPCELAQVLAHSGLDIASHFEPSLEIGGDFWGVKAVAPNKSALWMVDFSGHGITAALNAFRLQAYLKESSAMSELPGNYLTQLNAKLLQLLLGGHFATMFYGVLDSVKNQLSYSCACAPHPLLVNGHTGKAQLLEGKGNLLGISLHEYPTHTVEMQLGDTLILYSDALTETPDANGRRIDESELLALAGTYSHTTATQLRDVILDYFRSHAAGRVQDDFTLCVCKRAV